MNIYILRVYVFVLLCFCTLFACNKTLSDIEVLSDPNNPIVKSPVTTSVVVLILDENKMPFGGVTINCGNQSNLTDARGYARFSNLGLDRYSSLLTAEKPGYFKGYRVFCASQKGTNFIKMQLLKKVVSGNINSSTGGTVDAGGYKITLPPGAVMIKSSGLAYSGEIVIAAQYIDPSRNDISVILPGSLFGIDSANKRVGLKSFGMVAVELIGSNGESLQLTSGQKATIELAIPPVLIAAAPQKLPLWYIDETTGVWKQEGYAFKNGNSYSGEVSHFSFWNCDLALSAELVYLGMTLKNARGYPLPYSLVELSQNNPAQNFTYGTAYGMTDSTGYVGGLVPANEALLMTVFSECFSVSASHTINPVNQNTDLGTITTDLGAASLVISGIVKDCSGQPVSNGFVNIYLEDKFYSASVSNEGRFGINVTTCTGGTVIIMANDIALSQAGNPYVYNTNNDQFDSLNITACGNDLTQYTAATLAGNNLPGAFDGTGTAASFHTPAGIAFDVTGNIFVADQSDHCIRKITPSGVVTTFAGNYFSIGSADGLGSNARFSAPNGVAINSNGDIFVTDNDYNSIRKIIPAGNVTTFVGGSVGGYLDGVGLNARFFSPGGMAFDSNNNLYVADIMNSRIRKITPDGTVTTFAGDGTEGYADGQGIAAKIKYPEDLVFDAQGNLYVTDGSNHIRKITSTGVVTTVAGDGTAGYADGNAGQARFNTPVGIDISQDGYLYVSDNGNHRIRRISPRGFVTTIAGSTEGYLDGMGATALFSYPIGLAMGQNGKIYVSDAVNNRIRVLTPQ